MIGSGEAEIAGVAILPRKRVRTSWNGTGHSCLASNAWAVLLLGPLVAFFISFRPQQRSCSSFPNLQLRAADSLSIGAVSRVGPSLLSKEHDKARTTLTTPPP